MNLIVDIGNSRIKVAVVDGQQVVESATMDGYDQNMVEHLTRNHPIQRSIVSSTRGTQSEVVESVRRLVGHCLPFSAEVAVPIDIQYTTPHTLGRDRLAAAVGARVLYGGGDMLIVDFGSAITADLVSHDGGFEGGVISPGVAMRFRALHEFTASLPLCTPTDNIVDVARSTHEAIEQGVMGGIALEIEGYIARLKEKYDKISVIFLGGDAKHFEKRVKNAIFADKELLFVGLSRILDYNAD